MRHCAHPAPVRLATDRTSGPTRAAAARLAAALLCALALPGVAGAARKPSTGTVDVKKMHQEIAGFGAAEAYYQGFLARHPDSRDIYDALFGPESGLHTDFLRLQNRFRYEPRADFDQDSVDIVQHANALRTRPMTIVMSSWSPPAVLKSNHSEKNGGTLIAKNGHYDYADFAQYWKDSVTVYRALGVDPTYVSIQNEPDETTDYESCRFNPTEAPFNGELYAGYDKAVDAVYKAFQTMPSPPLMIGPETIGIGYGTVQAFIKALPMQDMYAVANHLYTGGDKQHSETYASALQAVKDAVPGKIRMQTEYYTDDGFQTALMIYEAMVSEEVSLYLEWPYAWPGASGALIEVENPAEPAKWKNPQGWRLNDDYFAFKHYSYFIHANYRRVEASSSNDDIKLSAYLSPKGDTLAVVAVNNSSSENAIQLKLGGFERGRSTVYRTTFPAKTERFANLGALSDGNVLTLPPHAVATVEIVR